MAYDQGELAEIDRLSRGPELNRAIAMAHAAVQRGDEHPLLFNLIAFGEQTAGRFLEALQTYERALALDPGNPTLLVGAAGCLVTVGQNVKAAEAYDEALRVAPDFPPAVLGRAQLIMQLGYYDDAETAFRHVLRVAPGNNEALASLAILACSRGELEAARRLTAEAEASPPVGLTTLLARLEVLQLEKDWPALERAARRILDTPLAPHSARALAQIRIGDACHERGAYPEAFAAWTAGKAIYREHYREAFGREDQEPIGDKFDRLRREVEALPPAARSDPAPAARRDPVFLVGFPRSGTTLLEHVLAAHPDLVSIEEKPTLRDSEEVFIDVPGGLQRLAEADEAELERWREAFWARVNAFVGDPGDRVVLDKHPARTFALPLIAKLFPNAVVLFAIRDPRDVALSCFRHAFTLNRFMFAFTELEETARVYDANMRFADAARARLGLRMIGVRHEILVTDFARESRRLLKAIGLDWRDELNDFAARASDKVIRTPSAHQVRAGLNTSGFDRWRAYAAEMAPVMDHLQPWVARFGYDGAPVTRSVSG